MLGSQKRKENHLPSRLLLRLQTVTAVKASSYRVLKPCQIRLHLLTRRHSCQEEQAFQLRNDQMDSRDESPPETSHSNRSSSPLLFLAGLSFLSAFSVLAGWVCLQGLPKHFVVQAERSSLSFRGSGFALVLPNGELVGVGDRVREQVNSRSPSSSDGRDLGAQKSNPQPPSRSSNDGLQPINWERASFQSSRSEVSDGVSAVHASNTVFKSPTSAFESAQQSSDSEESETTLRHVAFELASSMSTWPSRQELVKLWWKPGRMRGHVWMDKNVLKGMREPLFKVSDPSKTSIRRKVDRNSEHT